VNDSLPAPLLLEARNAVARAAAYLRGRQSVSGGFCFYKSEYVDEPNVYDTYHAVAALTLLRSDVPRGDELVEFLDGVPLFGPTYLYYYAFTLDLLGRTARIDAQRLTRIRELTIRVPRAGDRVVTSRWLENALKTIRLTRRFANRRTYPGLVDFIDGLKADGGYGDKPNLWDTYLSLRVLALLVERPASDETAAFVDRLQLPSFGFTITGDSLLANVDVIYAGTRCCAMLGIPIRYRADVLGFVLACQTPNGGFSRVPTALPGIGLTHRALEIMGLVERDVVSRAGRSRSGSG
jgi:hypothetical protein